jgi:hypothetical protein
VTTEVSTALSKNRSTIVLQNVTAGQATILPAGSWPVARDDEPVGWTRGGATRPVLALPSQYRRRLRSVGSGYQPAGICSKAQFDSIPLGTSEAAVVKMLAKPPQNPEEYVSNGALKQADIKTSCLYYNQIGHQIRIGPSILLHEPGARQQEGLLGP